MKTGDKYFIYCDISRWETHYLIATLSVSNNNGWISLVLYLIEMQVTIYLYFCCKLICKTGWVGELKSLEVKLLIFQRKRIHFHSPDTPWSAHSFRVFHSSLYLLSLSNYFDEKIVLAQWDLWEEFSFVFLFMSCLTITAIFSL